MTLDKQITVFLSHCSFLSCTDPCSVQAEVTKTLDTVLALQREGSDGAVGGLSQGWAHSRRGISHHLYWWVRGNG